MRLRRRNRKLAQLVRALVTLEDTARTLRPAPKRTAKLSLGL